MRSLRAWSAVAAFALLACSQGRGETCQRSRDCEDGLVCNSRGEARGMCVLPDEAEPDAGRDAGEPTLPPDDAAIGDAGIDDAGIGDAGDAGDEDAGGDPADLDAG